jgi:hypothetical protein
MEEDRYNKPSYYHYLANKIIFGEVNAVTGDTFKVYSYEPHREGLEVKYYAAHIRRRILHLGEIGYLKAHEIEGNGVAKVLTLFFHKNTETYIVHDTIFSNINFERYDKDLKKESRYAIITISMLIEALETKTFRNIPMILNDLPEIAQLLILHREYWAEN